MYGLKSGMLFGALGLALGVGIGPSALAQSSDGSKGKPVQMVIAGASGGSYSFHVRVLQKYLTKHLPDNPSILIEHMPGAGGIKAANYLYNVAPPNGYSVGTLLKSIAIDQALGKTGIKYDVNKFGWLISTGPIDSVLALWSATSPAKTLEEARQREVILGSTGKGSPTYLEPLLMNNLMGMKFKIITGYSQIDKVHLAMQNGESHGRFASWESLLCCKQEWLRDKKVVLLAQSGLTRNADLPDVPRMVDLARNETDRKFLEFFGAASTLGRIYLSPPGVPEARFAVLRKAFWDAAHDPDYVAEMKRRGLEWTPITGDEARKMAMVTMGSSADIIRRAKEVIGTSDGGG